MRVSTSERTLCRGSETLANGGASTFGTVQDFARTDTLTYLQVLRVIHYVSCLTRVHISTRLSTDYDNESHISFEYRHLVVGLARVGEIRPARGLIMAS
jgi:hypothetical protein